MPLNSIRLIVRGFEPHRALIGDLPVPITLLAKSGADLPYIADVILVETEIKIPRTIR